MRISPAPSPYLGYWQVRGWSDAAIVQSTTIIDTRETTAQNGTALVGGIAFAGARCVQKVEVSISKGPWQEATLKTPPLAPQTWVLWSYAFLAKSGDVVSVVARCTDGQGVLQTDANRGPTPDGATGYHRVVVTVR